MLPHLTLYPNKSAAHLLRVRLEGVCRSLTSALELLGVAAEKVAKEVSLGRMVGPFSALPLPDFWVPYWD